MKTFTVLRNRINFTAWQSVVLFAFAILAASLFAGWLMSYQVVSASTLQPADVNNDNKVDIEDVKALLAKWGTADTTTDVNKDGTVGVSDLSMVVKKWGAVAPATTGWMSGASGDGVIDGSFGTWRGTPVQIAGTWNDSQEAQTYQWSILPGAEFGSWTKDLDIAVGAIYIDSGESWSAAATGAYDARWTTTLNTIKTARGSKAGTMHLRFAHEFNGDWVPWKVQGSDTANFIASWKRFRVLQKQILPNAKLVFCPNDGSSSSLSLDWRNAFPGAAYVDEMAVDSYNMSPFVSTQAQFTSKINLQDSYGAPIGIEKHRQYAASVGLPLAISEWSSRSPEGDSPTYIKLFHDWVASNSGTGAGQVPYEILFNISSFQGGIYQLFPNTLQPNASAEYVKDF